ncbi:EpsG family protein [Pasteurellaceae bacterium HPA106]|uniref:EpsG family protein n=1 Tax=Spirabiliibacterium pneumoniae TaxID=221400 RepID=UPI001AAC701D|nr:EpsG family protein [Spirabiliibacterium pneumoniae]MBE2895833.1 EpsG family protein [Spirabiliibacterium pneumoniae]
METLTIYIFILFSASFFGFFYQKIENKKLGAFFVSISFMIPFVFLAIRYDIGQDYQNYVEYFYRIANGESVNKELGYIFINKAILYYNVDFQWFFVVLGFLYIFFSYISFPKKFFAISVFLFISITYLYEGFSLVRQGVAVAIMAYASRYILEKRFFLYLVFSILAGFFHIATAFVLLLCYPIYKINLKPIIYVIFIILAYLFLNVFHVIDHVFNLFFLIFPKYRWYAESQFTGKAISYSGVIGPVIKITIACAIFMFKEKITTRFSDGLIHINFYFLYTICYVFHLNMSIFGRVEHIFIYSSIFVIPMFLSVITKKNVRFLSYIIILSFYLFLYVRYVNNGTKEVDNDVYINPYQTIFSDNRSK